MSHTPAMVRSLAHSALLSLVDASAECKDVQLFRATGGIENVLVEQIKAHGTRNAQPLEDDIKAGANLAMGYGGARHTRPVLVVGVYNDLLHMYWVQAHTNQAVFPTPYGRSPHRPNIQSVWAIHAVKATATNCRSTRHTYAITGTQTSVTGVSIDRILNGNCPPFLREVFAQRTPFMWKKTNRRQ